MSKGCTAKLSRYRRRRPEHRVVYEVVQHHLEDWLAKQRELDWSHDPVPGYVEADLRRYLDCGILAHGFARADCSGCGEDFLLAFSCKGRGICPSCNARRMVETAAHLVDHVFPAEAVRQWVVTFPKRLRYYLLHDSKLFNRVVQIVQSEIQRVYERETGGEVAGVTFIHRFGGALNAHLHLHICVLDGGIDVDAPSLGWTPSSWSTQAPEEAVREAIRTRVLSLLQRRDILTREEANAMARWSHGGGFCVHGQVRVERQDKAGRERLFRYCARAMFSSERLSWSTPEKMLCYRLKAPSPKGELALYLTPEAFLARVSVLIPPPRRHRYRYFGCFAPNAPQRRRVTAQAGKALEEETPMPRQKETPVASAQSDEVGRRSPRYTWARLLARIYECFPLCCPHCGAEMRIIAFITESDAITKILTHLGEPTTAPTLRPARAPPLSEADVDQRIFFEEQYVEADYWDQRESW